MSIKLTKESVEWAIKSVFKEKDSFMFPSPFEFEIISNEKEEVKNFLTGHELKDIKVGYPRTTLVPKTNLGFRIATQLDPLDSIITRAIIYELQDEIKNFRVEVNKNIVHSFRLKIDEEGNLYDKSYNWKSFIQEAKNIIETKKYNYVVKTDISDFFYSIYLHNIESLSEEVFKDSYSQGLFKYLVELIRVMNTKQTHKGIPVGPQFSRILAELVLTEIDKQLIENNIPFVRYVDDFLIFSKDYEDAYKNLIFLANSLFSLRNLKLNINKTNILKSHNYIGNYINKFEKLDEKRNINNLKKILEEIGISMDPYADTDIDSISEENLKKLRDLELEECFKSELEKHENIDYFYLSYLIRVFMKTENKVVLDVFFNPKYFLKLLPLTKIIVKYIKELKKIENKHLIGKKIIKILKSNMSLILPYSRMWLLNLFTQSPEWDKEGNLLSLVKDNILNKFLMRELILALSMSERITYFRNLRNEDLNFDPWVRRAFFYGMKCLPKREKKPLCDSLKKMRNDYLENLIIDWVIKG